MGGSYFLEHLTNKIEEDVEKEMARIEKNGGILQGITDGSVRSEIAHQAYEREKKIHTGGKIVVGVNKFVSGQEEQEIQLHQLGQNIQEKQVARLEKVKSERDHEKVKYALDEIRNVATGHSNLVTPIISAVKEYATVGEICNVLRDVFGEYQEVA
jgi:methylmalonyl-CoA mutase N-terminal domain/subunit